MGGVRLNLCGVSTRLPGVALDRAGQSLALSEKCSPCLKPKTRVSATRPPRQHPLLPDIPRLGQEAQPRRGHRTVPRRGYGYLAPGNGGGEGRRKEKLRAAASLFLFSLPFSRRIHEKSVQGLAQPPGSGVDSIPPGRGDGDGRRCGGNPSQQEGQNATETAQRWGREKGQEGRISSQEAQGPPRDPVGREQPPGGEMLGEPPAPFQSRDKGWRL